MGALALALAGMPTQQASAWIKFGFNFNYCFEWSGIQCPCFSFSCCPSQCNPCGGYIGPQYTAVFPGMEHYGPPPGQQFPPPPAPGGQRDERRKEEAAMQWGYPALNYSYYHPVSYYPAQAQPDYYPAGSYYSPQYYYPANYGAPSYYQAPGMSFDR